MLNHPSILAGEQGNPRRSGLTLIELLIVILILGLIMILAIPRLRMINEDRSVREAARTAGSVFAKASQRAITDGVAGVCIELNPNIYDVDNVQYAGTALFMLQKLPPYTGDDTNSKATRVVNANLNILDIPIPYSMNLSDLNDERNSIRINDFISVNHSSVKYQVGGLVVSPDNANDLRITLVADPVLPLLPDVAASYPFVVHRQPRIQQSSRVQMPEGYLIDLRYSGEVNNSGTVRTALPITGNLPIRSVFHDSFPPPIPPIPPIYPPRNFETRILFAEDGFIDRYQIPRAAGFFRPNGDLYFFIARYETNKDREQVNSPAKTSPEPDPLDSPTNMWLKVDVQTGATTISYNAPPPTGPHNVRILQARSIASTGQAAGD